MHPVLRVVAAMGQGSDSGLAHVAKGDVVVPHEIISSDVHSGLQKLFAAKGRNKDQFTVGSGANKINPKTGLPGFDAGDGSGGDNTDSGGNGTGADSGFDSGNSGSSNDAPGDTSVNTDVPNDSVSTDTGTVTGHSTGTADAISNSLDNQNVGPAPGPTTASSIGTPSQSELSDQLAAQQEATNANVAAGGHGFGVPGVDTDEAPNGLGTGVDSVLYGLGIDTKDIGRSIAEFGLNTVLGLLTGGLGPTVHGAVSLGNAVAGHYGHGFGSEVYGGIQSALSNNPGTPTAPNANNDNGPGGGDFQTPSTLEGTAFNQPVGQSVGTPVVQSSSPAAAAASAPQSDFGTGIDDIVRRAGLA